jgi:hypothetical protein
MLVVVYTGKLNYGGGLRPAPLLSVAQDASVAALKVAQPYDRTLAWRGAYIRMPIELRYEHQNQLCLILLLDLLQPARGFFRAIVAGRRTSPRTTTGKSVMRPALPISSPAAI